MKKIPTSRKYRCLAGFGIFLITVALIAGIVGCSSDQYVLTIRCKEGGQITSPANTSSTYGVGTVINLTAEPEEGYRFDGWTGGVSTIADVNAAVTTITINGTYSITANFVQGQEIRDWFGLNATRTPDNLGGHHCLMNDLDSTTAGYNETIGDAANQGSGWQPIGASDDQFTGSFDGRGYEIRDLFIDRPDDNGSVGLFGYVAEGGIIEGIGLVNAVVTGTNYVGGLVGWNQGTVTNCHSDSNVTGTENYVGGLVGWNQGTVSNSYSSGNVTGSSEHVGGLVGWNEGTVSNCYSAGCVGGDEYVGGLVGDNHDGTVNNSYSTGSVTGDRRVGGLVGYNEKSSVSNSYSTGSVTGDRYIGGLVGYNEKSSVSKSYSVGDVIANTDFGGLVGVNNEGTVTNSFWDEQTSGIKESDGGKGETTAEMQDIMTFVNASWSICEVTAPQTNDACAWKIIDGQTYPFLSWQSASLLEL